MYQKWDIRGCETVYETLKKLEAEQVGNRKKRIDFG